MERTTEPVEGQYDCQETAVFEFRVAQEALEGSKTISQISSEHEVHANLIGAWKQQLLEDGSGIFYHERCIAPWSTTTGST